MPWTSLEDSLRAKPQLQVLAGPILRKVEPESVTVWLALRTGGSVKLTVQGEDGRVVMDGVATTIALGKQLHMVAVTARPTFAPLTEGIVYRYDIAFTLAGTPPLTLAEATLGALLGYAPPFTGPSFSLPPEDPNHLRLIHGSCRMPHAQGLDTLPIVDTLISETVDKPYARPHQLLLTGDQIYADDVSDALRLVLSDAAETLLGWNELLPLPASDGGPRKAALIHPWRRFKVLWDAGFTSVDLRGHLMSLGEYLCMYMFVWSPALWPPSLPAVEDVVAALDSDVPSVLKSWPFRGLLLEKPRKKKGIQANIKRVTEFSALLFQVRRVLANVPSYMIFDDHEVTDDWNMTYDMVTHMHESALGLRVVQNALAAYTLCQHWGNVPERFDAARSPLSSEGLLLAQLHGLSAESYDQRSETIRTILGVPPAATIRERQLRNPGSLFHDAHTIDYHFTVEGPGHQIIFTDTRTWRSYPHKGRQPSEILTAAHLEKQIVKTKDTGDRALLVVLSTNAPPIEPIRFAARVDRLTNFIEHHPDLYESWEIPSVAFDRLLRAVTDKLPLEARQHVGHAILLSGDVHHSFATRLVYRATNRFEDVTPQPATAVVAQLVASSFKKEDGKTRDIHAEGYSYLPAPVSLLDVLRRNRSEGYVGWNVRSKTTVAYKNYRLGDSTTSREVITISEPKTLDLWTPDLGHLSWDVELQEKPHYRYRLDYLLPVRQQIQLQVPPMPPLLPGTDAAARRAAAERYRQLAAQHRTYNRQKPPKVVGVNNFGEISFAWSGGPDKKVHHTLRWWAATSKIALTTYTISLNADPSLKGNEDIKAKVEQP
jgi:hypothetical protein